ncbi:MAG: cytochrome c oxidase subunit II transmembrane domain-containing protein, partial [Mucilaginibacter sp.]
MKLLVLLAIVLLIIAGHQLLRIIELSRGLKKTKEWQLTNDDNNMMGKGMIAFMVFFFLFFFWQVNRWIDRSLPPAASEHGIKIDQLWDANMWLIIVVFLVTNFFLFYFSYKYRGNTKNTAKFFAHDNKLEMLWTIV